MIKQEVTPKKLLNNMVLSLIILCTVLFLIVVYMKSVSKTVMDESNKQLTTIAQEGATLAKQKMDSEIALSTTLSETLSIYNFENIEQMKENIHIFNDKQEYTNILIADIWGDAVSTTNKPLNIRNKPEFVRAIKGESSASEPYMDSKTGKQVITVMVPIKQEDQVIGVFGTTKHLEESLAVAKTKKYSEEDQVYIIDKQGNKVFDPEKQTAVMSVEENIISDIKKYDLNETKISSLEQDLIQVKEGLKIVNAKQGRNVVSYSPIDESSKCFYMVSVPEQVILNKANNQAMPAVILALVICTIMLSVYGYLVLKNKYHK